MKMRWIAALPPTFLLLTSEWRFQPRGGAGMARLRVWAGFVWLRVQEKVSLWSRRDLDPWYCRAILGNWKRFFSTVTGQILRQGPAGRGQAEPGWGQRDVQPAGWGGKDGVREFSGPFAACSGLFTYLFLLIKKNNKN